VSRRFKSSQLNSVKDKLKEINKNKEDASEEKTTLADIKKQVKEFNESEGIVYEKKSSAKKQAKKTVKRSGQQSRMQVTWNIKLGDLVLIKNNNESEPYGIVVKEQIAEEFKSMREAKYRSHVLVLSPAGRQWCYASQLEKINI
jgi:hypothetical protein